MLISEQSDLVKALLATAGITAATDFDVRAGWLIVDGVPHRVYADAVVVPEVPPAIEPPATEPPAIEPPATEPPAIEPPATEPPAIEPPATEPPAIEPPATEPQPPQ